VRAGREVVESATLKVRCRTVAHIQQQQQTSRHAVISAPPGLRRRAHRRQRGPQLRSQRQSRIS